MPSDVPSQLYFRLFNEIGIVNQLATTILEERLPNGLLASHFAVLNHLVRVGDGRTLQELARSFQLPKATVTHQVGVLEIRTLVIRRPNPDDGRSKQVWLTPAGKALRAKIVDGFDNIVESWSDQLPPELILELLPRLERLRKHLDSAPA